jgi:hypothetical protein
MKRRWPREFHFKNEVAVTSIFHSVVESSALVKALVNSAISASQRRQRAGSDSSPTLIYVEKEGCSGVKQGFFDNQNPRSRKKELGAFM